jgi:hypothetical protein
MSAVNGFETLRSRPWVAKWADSFSSIVVRLAAPHERGKKERLEPCSHCGRARGHALYCPFRESAPSELPGAGLVRQLRTVFTGIQTETRTGSMSEADLRGDIPLESTNLARTAVALAGMPFIVRLENDAAGRQSAGSTKRKSDWRPNAGKTRVVCKLTDKRTQKIGFAHLRRIRDDVDITFRKDQFDRNSLQSAWKRGGVRFSSNAIWFSPMLSFTSPSSRNKR